MRAMKVSELITKLSRFITEHGDLEIEAWAHGDTSTEIEVELHQEDDEKSCRLETEIRVGGYYH